MPIETYPHVTGKRLLLFSATPKSDESFLGYLLRLTELNYYASPSWIMRMAGLATHASNKAFVFNNTQNLSPLKYLTGVNEAKLAELVYQPAGPSRKKMGDYLLFGSAITQYLIRPDRPKICSRCLRESDYTRRMWEIIPVTTCPVHRCLLLDACPKCKARIVWNREGISQCKCGFDWRDSKPLKLEGHELLVTEQVYRLCNLIPADNKVIPLRSRNNPLYTLDLKHFLSALLFVASQYGGFIDTKGKYIVSVKHNADIHKLLDKAFLAFDEWPTSFFSFLDWRRTQMPNQNSSYGLRREFKEYKFVLYRQLSSVSLDFLRHAFQDYLATRWEGGYVSNVRRLNKTVRMNAKYISLKEASALLKTSYIYELIESGRLKARVKRNGKKNLVLIERATLVELKRELDHALSMGQLCTLLALPRERIRELVNTGQLNPLRGPTVDGLAVWKFSITEAKRWLKVFKDKAILHGKASSFGKLPLLKVIAKFDQYGVSFGKLFQAVADGTLTPIERRHNNGGLSQFFYSDEQVTTFLRNISQLHGEETYSVAAVARILTTRKALVYLLIRSGFLQAEKLSKLSSAGLVIKKSQLELFNSKFVLAKDIARQLGTNPRYIHELLKRYGVAPVSDRKANRYSLLIFKRSDINGVDLANLVYSAKSEARIILPYPLKKKDVETLNKVEAAEILSVPVAMIEQLIERGLLRPYRRKSLSKICANECIFYKHAIQWWKEQAIDYTGIVSFIVATKMIGARPDNFYKRYIRTGRLKAVVTGKQRGGCYFSIGDVEAIIKLNEETITTSEAAGICRVNLTCIHKLIRAGELVPISGPKVDGFGNNLHLRSDVEKLRSQRDDFKAKRCDEGGTSRFGRLGVQQCSPVLEKIRPRVSQLVGQWSTKPQRKRISGQHIHKQLIKEGYQVGINTVYVCLRELRQEGSLH